MAEIRPIRQNIQSIKCQSYIDISYLVAPGPVSDITVLTTTSRSLMLSWTQPCHPNGIIINYKIKIQIWNDSRDNQGRFTNINNTFNTNNNSTSFNVTILLSYRFYVFTVNTEVQGVGNLSEPTVSEPFQTDTEGIWFFHTICCESRYCFYMYLFTIYVIYVSSGPYIPGNITFSSITSSSVQVWWEHPNIQIGPTSYEVVATDEKDSSITKSCNTEGSILLYLCVVTCVSVEIYVKEMCIPNSENVQGN